MSSKFPLSLGLSFLLFLSFFPSLSYGEIKPFQWKSYASLADARRMVWQDKFLWIAGGGLTRYPIQEGAEERHLVEQSRISNAIHDVAIDNKNDTLWVATSDGLGRLDLKKKTWTSFGKEEGLSDPFILSLSVYNQGEETVLYIGTKARGLYIFQKNSNRIDPIPGHEALPDQWVSSLAIDPRRQYLWIGTMNGLIRYNLKASRFEKAPPPSRSRISVKRLSIDEKTGDVFCLSYLDELFHYRLSTQKLERLFPPIPKVTPVNDLSFDPLRKILWVSSQGIHGYKIEKRVWITLPGMKDAVSSILLDQGSQFLYYATLKGIGCWKFREGRSYSILRNSPPFHNTINALLADNQRDCLWVGTDGGIARLEAGSQKWSYFPIHPFPEERALSLGVDHKTLWVGTMYHGLVKVDVETGKMEEIKGTPESATVTSIIRDSSSPKVWFGLLGTPGGVYEYDSEKTELKPLPHLEHLSVTSMVEDGEWIWVGTHRGVAKFNKAKGPSEATLFEDQLFFDDVLTLALDTKRDHLWITTEWGVKVYDKAKRQCKTFTGPEGFPRSAVTALLFDGESIWFGTEGYGVNRYRPDTGLHQNMTTADGLASNYIISLATVQRNGTIWAGTVSGGISVIEKPK